MRKNLPKISALLTESGVELQIHECFGVFFSEGVQQKVDFKSLLKSLHGTEELAVKSILRKQDGRDKIEKPAEAIHIREVCKLDVILVHARELCVYYERHTIYNCIRCS